MMRTALLHIADGALSVGLLKVTILLAIAVAGIASARRASASVRATLWATTIVTLVGLPVLWKLIPWWNLGILAFPQPLFQPDSALALALPQWGSETPPALWVGVLWALGAALLLANFVRQRIGVELQYRAGEPATDLRIVSNLGRLRQVLGVRKPVRVVYSATASGPYAFGLRRPTIVLPDEARSWDDEQLDAILRHELAHVARGDYALLLAGELVRVLYWFNPAVWFALAAMRRSQDAACDDVVLSGGVPAVQYARHLVAVARSTLLRGTIPRAALPLSGGPVLRDRVGAILARGSDRRSVSRVAVRWCAAAAVGVAATLASMDLWICPTTSGAAGQVTVSPATVVQPIT